MLYNGAKSSESSVTSSAIIDLAQHLGSDWLLVECVGCGERGKAESKEAREYECLMLSTNAISIKNAWYN